MSVPISMNLACLFVDFGRVWSYAICSMRTPLWACQPFQKSGMSLIHHTYIDS